MESVAALAALAADRFTIDGVECNYRLGAMAPLVTTAALAGSPLAQSVCDQAARSVAIGIRLVGTAFKLERVPFALIGGSARSGYMQQAVAESLRPSGGRYEAVAPALPPVAGAVLMALSQCGRAGDELATCLEQSLPAEAWPGGDVPTPV